MLLSVTMALGAAAVITSCGGKGNTSTGNSAEAQVKTTATIKFDVNLEGYETNSVKDKTVTIGKKVPIAKAYIMR